MDRIIKTVVIIILANLFWLPGMVRAQPPLFSLEAECMKGFHYGIGSIYSISCPTWYVELKITNITSKIITLDAIEAVFAAEGCNGLTMTTTRSEEAASPYWEIYPGETQEFEFDTNGWTYDILNDADGRQVLFMIGFYYQYQLIDGYYAAPLPDFNELPNEYEILMKRREGRKAQGIKLYFR